MNDPWMEKQSADEWAQREREMRDASRQFPADPIYHARFWAKVDCQGVDECWPWTGARQKQGYGNFCAKQVFFRAHRVAYELLVGRIPKGLQLDHLCLNKWCVNPAHLEPVTSRENTRRALRKDACINGHPYDEANTYLYASGIRACRACNRATARRRRAERRAVAA